jgi:multiple sugar transport system ATP-binding protein
VGSTGVEGVTVVRAGAPLLRDVTLSAAAGELLVVLGSSGSGKTTLLRVIAGLDKAASGRVVIKGRDVTGLSPRARHVSMTFQGSALMPFFDVARNLGWGLEVQRLPETEIHERVTGRARHLGLSRLLARRPGELSSGQRSLVGIGHALVARPDVFLLDEPLAGLDPAQRTNVRRQIVDVVRSLGVPTFYVTQDQGEGLAVADRVALLDRGRVVQVGRPRDLYERPVDLLAAGLVGAPPIGLLPARLVLSGGLAGFEVGTRTIPLWQPVPGPLREHVGREVVLGLRAEDVPPAAPGHDPDAVSVAAVVTNVEYSGRQNVVTVAVDSPPITAPVLDRAAETFAGATLRSLFPRRAVVCPGDAVRLAVDGARAHVFDAVTGRALWHPDGAAR